MALIIKDRVKEITTTTGTGAVSLAGASATFDTFQSVMSNGDTTFYAIVHTASGTDEWEVGLGTWNTGNTLTRTTVYAGSNGTSAVNFSSGNKDIFMTYPASKAAVAGEDVTFADVTATDITATGTVTLSGDPTSALHAASKEYVDTIAAAGIHYHTPVRVEAPSNLNATYDNGSSGVGATLTNAGTQAALVIDGITLSTSDRVLVYNQTNAAHNGIYTVTNTGSVSTNWVLTRATDADSYGASDPDALGEGDAYFVKEGDTGAGELYVMNTAGTITFGTTNITFTVIAETAVYSAGTGLTLTGTTFSTNQDISTSASPTFNNITVTGTVDGRDVATDGSKLDGIEAGATADQTAAEIKTAYESNSNTNAFTDAEQTKLSGIETGATGDQTASEILTAIKTVDGAGSNLDADLLDGQQGSYYLNTGTTFSGDVSGTYGAMVVADDSHNHVISNVDGLQTALDGKTTTSRTITAGDGLTGGGDFTANRTINVGAGGGITVSADAVSHADTSSQASVNNSNGTVIQDVTLDTYGHVTGLTSANLDGRYYTETEADSRFVNVTGDSMTGALSVSADVTADNYYVDQAGKIFFLDSSSTQKAKIGLHSGVRLFAGSSGTNSNAYMRFNGEGNTPVIEPSAAAGAAATTETIDFGGSSNRWRNIYGKNLNVSTNITVGGTVDGVDIAAFKTAYDSHNHDSRYYTETEADSRFANVAGDTFTGHVNVTYNTNTTGSSAPAYGSANIELQTSSNYTPAISFHRGGYSAGVLYEYDGEIYSKAWVSKGQDGKLLSTGNISSHAWTSSNDGSGSGLDADKLDGYHLSTTRNAANTVPVRDGNGYLQLGWINTTSGATSTLNKIYASSDSYIRYVTPATFRSQVIDGYYLGASSKAADSNLLDGIDSSSFLRSDANDTASGAITLSADTTDVLNFSSNSTNDNRGISFNGRTAISADYNDGWLRINNASEFTSGVYIPSGMWISGTLDVSGSIRHQGDTDTSIGFGTNTITMYAGGSAEITVDTTGVRLGDTGNGYFQPVTGNYGSIQIDGGAHGGWEGYSIGGRAVFMHNNSTRMGLYDDVNNAWGFFYDFGGAAYLTHSGSTKLSTSSTGISVTGTVAATSYTGDGSSLTGISAGATGGGSDEIFWENGQNVTTNYTITNGKNAMSAGPITVNSGVTVTVGSGETWTVV